MLREARPYTSRFNGRKLHPCAITVTDLDGSQANDSTIRPASAPTSGFQNDDRARDSRVAPNRKALAASNSGSGAGAVSGSLSLRIDARLGSTRGVGSPSLHVRSVGAMNLATHILLRHTHTHSTDPATHTYAHTQPLDCCQNLRHSYPILSVLSPFPVDNPSRELIKNTLGQCVVEL